MQCMGSLLKVVPSLTQITISNMAFSDQEKQIIIYGKNSGKSKEEVHQHHT